MSSRRRTTASGNAPRCTQSFGDSSLDSPTPTTDDWQPLSQTDNRTPAPERRRRLSGAAPLQLRKPKTIHDRVYGAVTLPGVLVAAMDTAEFQRLDKIRQLGGSSFVFPSATHTRKEHSVGTAHLALLVVRHLRNTQPELAIDDADELCVGLAALLHDVGHGPYSHMWEPFVKKCTGDTSYSHEGMGARLVRRICTSIKLEAYVPSASVDFICTCIEGLSDDAAWPFAHISETKRFLCDIVSCKRSGLDVDKWDYLNRDSIATLGPSSSGFDVTRLVSAIRVVRGHRPFAEVAFEEKVALDLNRIFKLRSEMHQMVYQHRVAIVAEAMITDAFLAAEQSDFRVFALGEDGEQREFTLGEAALDCGAFTQLRDGLLETLQTSSAAGLEGTRDILDRLSRREFYQLVGRGATLPTKPLCAECSSETEPRDKYCAACGASTEARTWDLSRRFVNGDGRECQVVKPKLLSLTKDDAKAAILAHVEGGVVDEADVLIGITDIKYGWADATPDAHHPRMSWAVRDPLGHVLFFNPKGESANRGYHIASRKISQLFLPKSTHERVLYCYYRGDPENTSALRALTEAYEKYTAMLPGPATCGRSNPTPSPFARRRRAAASDGAPSIPVLDRSAPRALDMDDCLTEDFLPPAKRYRGL